jgi:tRNA A-37 threonylcarbamoyl transferase component Bud32
LVTFGTAPPAFSIRAVPSELILAFATAPPCHGAEIGNTQAEMFPRSSVQGSDRQGGHDRSEEKVLADRYRLIRRLGTGGMASVYLAEDCRLGREVAVKRLHSGHPDEDAQRFAREARIGATLNHPNLVTVFDTVSDEESVLIVMEYVGGTDLGTMLESGPYEEGEGLRILDSLADAIDHAHQHGVVHRDVKPSNILIRDDGEVKLADLGIARALEDTAITRSGVVVGTLLYMAPEVLQGEEAGPQADVYSMALIAYEVLTGKRARREGTVPEVTHRAINEPPPDLRELRPDLPVAAAEVLRRALNPEPSGRPSSASAVVRDLRDALQESNRPATVELSSELPVEESSPAEEEPPPAAFEPPVPAIPASDPGERRRRLALLGIGGALALAAIVVFAVLALGGGSDKGRGGGQGAPDAPARSAGGDQGSGAAGAASAASPASPDGAVQAFYENAAAGDYSGAWDLADSSFRSQLGGFDAFQVQQSTLESIEFPSLDVTSESGSRASVSFETVATHTGFVDHCTGSMSLVASGGEWLIDQAQDISCQPSSG